MALRRRIHRFPEIGLELPRTKQAILDELADLQLDVREASRTSALVAVLDGGRPGPTVLLRGDMDALPLQEETGLEFSSERARVMHACGHDAHVAMLASAARVLAGRREHLAGRVAFFFQPGEEGFHGAREALDQGLLGGEGVDADGNPVAGAFAVHISAGYRSGLVSVRPGPMLACSLTYADDDTAMDRLGDALETLAADPPPPDRPAPVIPPLKDLNLEQVMSPREAYFADTEQVKDPAGGIAAEMISPYPPGVPAVLPGERFNQAVVTYLRAGKGPA